jgi:hypothetical protein
MGIFLSKCGGDIGTCMKSIGMLRCDTLKHVASSN